MCSTGEGLCTTLKVRNGREPKPAEIALFVSDPLAGMQNCDAESKLYAGLLSDTQTQTSAL